MICLDDRLLILDVRVAWFGGCQRGLESDLPKGSVGWSGDETQMTKVICKVVTKVNWFVP